MVSLDVLSLTRDLLGQEDVNWELEDSINRPNNAQTRWTGRGDGDGDGDESVASEDFSLKSKRSASDWESSTFPTNDVPSSSNGNDIDFYGRLKDFV